MRRFALAVVLLGVVGCDSAEDPTLIEGVEAGTDGPRLADAGDAAPDPDDAAPTPDDAAPDPDDAAPLPDDAVVADAGPIPACANGQDDDGDGLADYPADPGCTDPSDVDEADPDDPACSDGEDNDGDDRTDHPDDPGCAAPEDPSEASACGALPHDIADISRLGRVEASTRGRPAVLESCRTNRAPEAVFRFTLRDAVDRLHFDTRGSLFDTQLAVYRACPTEGVEPAACNDDANENVRYSEVDLERPTPGDYFVVVDGFLEEAGDFVLTIRAELADGAACADVEAPLGCAPGRVCRDGTCQPSACADRLDNDGDGRIDFPNEPGCDSLDDDDETDPEVLPECADGIDNDFNGFSDYPDDEWCTSAADPEERRPPQCRDGSDNDRDGFTDLADPGCQGDPERDNEFNIEACRDGQDNDEDGVADYPSDPGCEGPRDPDETDPDPAPACGDGVDNDENGLTDYPDDVVGCTYAADPTEADPCIGLEPVEITGLANPRGNTDDAPNEFASGCNAQSGPESVLVWRVAEDRALQRMIITTRGTSYDTLLHVRDRCDAPVEEELACDDDGGPSGSSVVRLGAQAPGTELWVFVDGSRGDTSGIWRVEVKALLAEGANCQGGGAWICGDGLACREQNDGALRCEPSECADGVDNDDDGVIDWPAEPGCESDRDDDEVDPAEPAPCGNGIDDDEDGLIDWPDDGQCLGPADPSEAPECRDGVDNDEDGALDFDRDGNGFRDRNADRGCACADDNTELTDEPQCDDGCDNDNDGLVDLEDPGCVDDPERDNEFNVAHCRDGRDNDGDGHIDFPDDPGCPTRNHGSEVDPDPVPECGDGIDNDGDGAIDYAMGLGDDGCTSAADPDERSPCDQEHPAFPEDVNVVRDTTRGRPHQFVGTCGFGAAPDALYRLRLPYEGHVRVSTAGSDFDTVVYARTQCGAITVCDDPDPEPEPDAGPPDPPVDAAVRFDDGPPDGAADAGVPDAATPDAGVDLDAAPPEPDGAAVGGPECVDDDDCAFGDLCNEGACVPDLDPCVPNISTEFGCNDDFEGVQSQIEFVTDLDAVFVFVDGFADGSVGDYVLTIDVRYPLGGRCGPDLVAYADCELGTACLPDEAAGFPTCQLP